MVVVMVVIMTIVEGAGNENAQEFNTDKSLISQQS